MEPGLVQSVKGLLTLTDGDHSSYLSEGDQLYGDVAATLTDFLAFVLRGDADAADRLETPRTVGKAELVFAREPGSSMTVDSVGLELDRQASVEPTTNLVDGQLVTVTWSGFLPGRVVNAVQCSQGGVGGNDICDLTKGQILQPNPTGEGSLQLEIIAGPVGSGVCDSTTPYCVVVVNDAGLPDDEATFRIPISFAE